MDVTDGSDPYVPPAWYDGSRTANARALVVGAGSLGEEVVQALFVRGFRRMLIADPRTVGKNDVGRLPLVAESDVGRFRSETASRRMREKTTSPGFAYHAGYVRELDGWNYEVIIGCTGDVDTRLFVNARARTYDVPYIDVTADGMRGKLQVVLANGPCAECGMSRFRTMGLGAGPSRERTAARTRVDPLTARRMASLASEEALRIACGRSGLCTKGMLYYDGADGSTYTIALNVDPKCPNHSGEGSRWTLKSLTHGMGPL